MTALSMAGALLRDPFALLLTKVTLVLMLASGVAAVATGFSAARRHTLWLAALASCIWLALSSPVAPAILIRAPVLPPTDPPSASPTFAGPLHAGTPSVDRKSV